MQLQTQTQTGMIVAESREGYAFYQQVRSGGLCLLPLQCDRMTISIGGAYHNLSKFCSFQVLS